MTYPTKTADYLKVSKSGTFNAAGIATVSLVPDVGQWWFPTMMIVSTQSQVAPFATCIVYEGAPGLLTPQTAVDDTLYGYKDSSSMCSGLVVTYGEQFTAVFTGGSPGDTATFTVTGTVGYQPVGIGELLPTVPGTAFRGHGVTTSTLFADFSGTLLLIGSATDLNTQDFRAYQSYIISIQATGHAVPPTSFNGLTLITQWADDAAFTHKTYEQAFQFGSSQGAPWYGPGGTFYLHDQCHGSFLNAFVIAYGNDQIMLNQCRIYGSSRVVGAPYVVETGFGSNTVAPEDGQLQRNYNLVTTFTITAGNTLVWQSSMCIGDTIFWITVNAAANAGPMLTTWFFGEEYPNGVPTGPNAVSTAQATTSQTEIYVPACPVMLQVHNSGTATGTVTIRMVNRRTSQLM